MKFFTKEWYNLCQQTSMHSDFHVLAATEKHDEQLFQRLYKIKERKHIKFQRELYNIDPRNMFPLSRDHVPLEDIFDLSEIPDEHKITIYPSDEDMQLIEERIVAFDNRPPFDFEIHKKEFSDGFNYKLNLLSRYYPEDILSQVADLRVFALGYCTKQIYAQLKKRSKINSKLIHHTSELARTQMNKEQIDKDISDANNFHDCKVIDFNLDTHLIIKLDPTGGFTSNNQITFINPEILLDEGIVDKYWLYNEIYRYDDGYEVHILLGGAELFELIVRCKDIKVEQT